MLDRSVIKGSAFTMELQLPAYGGHHSELLNHRQHSLPAKYVVDSFLYRLSNPAWRCFEVSAKASNAMPAEDRLELLCCVVFPACLICATASIFRIMPETIVEVTQQEELMTGP